MNLNLKGKNAVITGGSKGIGRSIALTLAQEGANIAICARGEDALKNTAAEIQKTGVRVYSQKCDVGKSNDLDAFLTNSKSDLGSVDILVHNASALALGPTLDDWESSINVDLMGAVNACNKVIPWMAEAGGGSILLVSSTSGLECDPTPDYGYTASKAALIAYAKKLAVMHAPQNIRANAIAPGSTEFEGGVWDNIKKEQPDLYKMAKSMIPAGRLGTPEEIADVAVFLSSSRASWITGECVSVDGAQHRGMR